MPTPKVVEVAATSASVRLIDSETAEVWFLTEENRSLRVKLPQTALFVLARRIMLLSDPPSP